MKIIKYKNEGKARKAAMHLARTTNKSLLQFGKKVYILKK